MKRWKRVAVGGGLVLSLGLLVGVTRTLVFRRRGAELVRNAERFPRHYRLGKGEPTLYVSLGDSTAAGVGASRLEDTLPHLIAASQGSDVSVNNLSVSGATLRDLLVGQLPQLPADPITLVTLSISANDVTQNTDPAKFQRDLGILLTELQDPKVERVVLSTTPNFRSTPALPLLLNRLFESRADNLAAIIRQTSARYPNVRLADLNRRGTLTADQYAADGFHPSAAGYREWAALFVAAAKAP